MAAKPLLVDGGYTITVNPAGDVFKEGAVLIRENSIEDVGPRSEVLKRLGETKVDRIDASHSIVMPGLVSSHTHLFQNIFRGLADDLTVEEWVTQMIFPLSRYLDEEASYASALLGILEMIRTGTTCFGDSHYIHQDRKCMDGLARAVKESGIRGLLARSTQDMNVPDDFVESPAVAKKETVRCIEKYNDSANGRLRICPEALSPVECTTELIKLLHEIASHYGTGFHMHVAESLIEAQMVRTMAGKGVIEYLDTVGVLGPSSLFAHCVWVSPSEVQMLAETGTKVALNPVSNMFLADGFAPIPDMLRRRVTVGLGVDGAASNNSQDMFETMKFCLLGQRAHALDTRVFDAETVLEMATIGSAKCLGLEERVGSLEKGKKADVVILRLDQIAFTPYLRPVSHLVFSAQGRDVSTVIVDGQVLLQDGKFTSLNEAAILSEANRVAHEIIKKAGADGLVSKGRWNVHG
jgi:5-methylthioadenosine/S-adenosylhomocysteine deaminase